MKKYTLLSIIFLLIIGLVIGCAPARRVDPNDDNRRTTEPRNNTIPNDPNNLNNQNIAVPDNTAPLKNNNNNNNDMTQNRKIANIAKNVKGVNSATVVISGNTAYIGIDMDKNMENNATDEVKRKVGEAVKKDANNINKVYVSADVDSVERLKKIGRDIEGGRPISGFLDELTEMFRRPMPSAE